MDFHAVATGRGWAMTLGPVRRRTRFCGPAHAVISLSMACRAGTTDAISCTVSSDAPSARSGTGRSGQPSTIKAETNPRSSTGDSSLGGRPPRERRKRPMHPMAAWCTASKGNNRGHGGAHDAVRQASCMRCIRGGGHHIAPPIELPTITRYTCYLARR